LSSSPITTPASGLLGYGSSLNRIFSGLAHYSELRWRRAVGGTNGSRSFGGASLDFSLIKESTCKTLAHIPLQQFPTQPRNIATAAAICGSRTKDSACATVVASTGTSCASHGKIFFLLRRMYNLTLKSCSLVVLDGSDLGRVCRRCSTRDPQYARMPPRPIDSPPLMGVPTTGRFGCCSRPLARSSQNGCGLTL
jgi:hypothetical protein